MTTQTAENRAVLDATFDIAREQDFTMDAQRAHVEIRLAVGGTLERAKGHWTGSTKFFVRTLFIGTYTDSTHAGRLCDVAGETLEEVMIHCEAKGYHLTNVARDKAHVARMIQALQMVA